jgi:hypothetical protein
MLAWGVNAFPVGEVPVIPPKEEHTLIESEKAMIIDVCSKEKSEEYAGMFW